MDTRSPFFAVRQRNLYKLIESSQLNMSSGNPNSTPSKRSNQADKPGKASKAEKKEFEDVLAELKQETVVLQTQSNHSKYCCSYINLKY